MNIKYPHLCSPITIGNVTFRNRMFAAPVGGTDITNGDGGTKMGVLDIHNNASLIVVGYVLFI